VQHSVQRDRAKDIATGIAITTSIFVISVLVPLLGFFFSIFIPLPILFYRMKLGRNTGMIVPIGTLIIIILILGGISIDILFFAELFLLGFIMSELFERKLTIEKTIFYTCGIVLGTGFAGLLFYSNTLNIGIFALLSEYVKQNFELAMELNRSMGMTEKNLDKVSEYFHQVEYYVVHILPAMITMLTLFITWANLLIARPMLKGKSLFFPDFGKLNHWKAPENLIWGIIASGILLFFPDRGLKMVGASIFIILGAIYFFHGMAIVSFYFEKKNIPKMMRSLFYFLMVTQYFLWFIIIGLGVFDMWLDFRKISPKNE